MYLAVSGSASLEERPQDGRLARPAPSAARSRRTRPPPRGGSGSSRAAVRGRRRSARRPRRCPGRTSGRTPRRARTAGPRRGSVTVDAIADQPSPAARWSASAKGRPGQEDRRDRQLVGRERAEVVGQDGRLLGGPGGRRETLGELAPATHAADGIPCPRMVQKPWFPEALIGSRVVLRRHVPGNIAAFRRWYADPEIARLARYQATPDATRGDRALLRGPRRSAPTRWRWPSTSRRPTGSSGPAPSASSTATTARRSTTSRSASRTPGATGYGTEATQLMVDHAFGTLGPAPDRAVRLRVQRAGHPRLPALRLRGRGPLARVDLARRPLVGRAGDERPRVGLAGAPRRWP